MHATNVHAAHMHATHMHAARAHAAQMHAARMHATQVHAALMHAAHMPATRRHVARLHATQMHAAQMHAAHMPATRMHATLMPPRLDVARRKVFRLATTRPVRALSTGDLSANTHICLRCLRTPNHPHSVAHGLNQSNRWRDCGRVRCVCESTSATYDLACAFAKFQSALNFTVLKVIALPFEQVQNHEEPAIFLRISHRDAKGDKHRQQIVTGKN
eukprot:6188333-Pleurochrysis_carterae.AAC.8